MPTFSNPDVGSAILQSAQVVVGALQFQQQMAQRQQEFEANFKLKEENLKQEAANARLKAEQAQIQLQINQQNAESATAQAGTSQQNAATSRLQAETAAKREARLSSPEALDRAARLDEANIKRIEAETARQNALLTSGGTQRVVRTYREVDHATDLFMQKYFQSEEAIKDLEGQLPLPGTGQKSVSAADLLAKYGPIAHDPAALFRRNDDLTKQLPDATQVARARADPASNTPGTRAHTIVESWDTIKAEQRGLQALASLSALRATVARTNPEDQRVGMALQGVPPERIAQILAQEKLAGAEQTLFAQQGLTRLQQDVIFTDLDQGRYDSFVSQIKAHDDHRSAEGLKKWARILRHQYGDRGFAEKWPKVIRELNANKE